MVIERSSVAEKDCWNVEALFPSLKEWQENFDAMIPTTKPRWPQFGEFREEAKDGDSDTWKAILDLYFAIDRLLSLLYTYAHLRHDEDIVDEEAKIAYSKALSVIYDFGEETAWIEPALIAMSESKLNGLLSSPLLQEYRFHIEKIIRVKAHTLQPEQEEMLARVGKSLQTAHKAFSALNDADFKFGKVTDSEGNERELTHGLYGLYLRTQDRELRKNSFFAMHGKYADHENTLCELLQGQVQSHVFSSQTRNYSSCLQAALYPKNIDIEVYHSLIKAVNDGIASLHKYASLRKKVLKVDSLHLYDMYVPLVKDIDFHISYDEAEDLIIESVKPLGSDYQNLLRHGLKDERWVDRYENKNKRSGAYSSGCYDSMPYILMNYKGILKDCFTLAHEAGHSMHSLLTHLNQPYQYGHYPIFLAEVASTFNEELLMQQLLARETSKEKKIFLINEKIEDLRGTLFRQTMFAEFELLIHELAEKETPLTPQLLRNEYTALNKKYFGSDVTIDELGAIEWARIPHFYYNFYVFQYGTGISAALALADRVLQGGEREREEYLSFLKGGSSRYPIELLKDAGVDMRSPVAIKSAVNKFAKLVDELEKLLEV